MSSRSDYLSKYLSSDKKKKHKRTPKLAKHVASNLIVEQPTIQSLTDDEEVVEEQAPVVVNLSSESKTGFKGFKRIDGKEPILLDIPQERIDIKTPESLTPPKEPLAPPTQTTVYRDSSGRIVDIESRRKQFQKEKEVEAKLKEYTAVTLTEDEISAQNTKPKVNRSNFDDPMMVFDPAAASSEYISERYSYTKGVSPANRFMIKAGCMWDGIDRSNGFEMLILRRQNEVKYSKMESKINESYEVELDD